MYKKNDASPKPLFAPVVNASTGAPITSGVACKHYKADGTETECDNSEDHEGNGTWRYVPSQAETNETTFAVKFYHADAVGDGPLVQVITTQLDPDDAVRMGMSALPNAAADASGGLPISDAGGLDLDELLTGTPAVKYAGGSGPGVYVDSGASNTNTVVGTDGTVGNPVSTFAAARTLADAIGLNRYYIEGNSDITLAATHVDWEFCGVGAVADNIVNFGSQDVSRSRFCNLTLEGTQGGSSRIEAVDCALQDPGGGATTLHIFALRCGLVDDIEIDTSNNNVFDSCYSLVAGAATPSIIATGAAGTLEVRHYSGGLELKALSASHNVSIEGMGQIVFNSNCNVNANVSIRGLFTITDNTAGMASLTQDAVVNMLKINAEADTALSDYGAAVPGDEMLADLTKIHGGPLNESVHGYLANRFEDFFNQSSVGFSIATPLSSFKATGFAVAGDAMLLTAAGQQDVAQIIKGTAGTVWYVSSSGDNSNGLTPNTAYTNPKTTIEAASAGDTVLLDGETFALGDNTIEIPNGVNVFGAGMDSTWLTSTAELGDAGEGCIVKPGTKSVVADMTIEGTLDDGSYQAPIGTTNVGSASQAAFTNAVGRNLRLIADTDSVYMVNSSDSSLMLIDCIVQAKYDGILVNGTGAATCTVTLIRTPIIVEGPSAVANGYAHAVVVQSAGVVRSINSSVHVTDGGAVETIGYDCSGGIIEAYGGSVYTSGAAGNIYNARRTTGTLVMSGVDYDRSKTSGTIVEISGVGSAMAASPVADSLMQRVQAIDVLTEVSGGGDLAANLTNTSRLTAARAGALTDWIDDGRLDLLLDAIPTTAMRGTDNAAVAGDAMTLTAGERNSVADALLNRGASNIEGSADKHSLGACVMIMTNSSIAGTTLTAKKPSDDSTFQTYTVTVDASADPITGVS